MISVNLIKNNFGEEFIMENIYSQIDVNAYVARYMDQMGCNLNEACEALEIDPTKVFTLNLNDEEVQ